MAETGAELAAEPKSLVVDPLGWLNEAERYAYTYFVAHLRRGGSETFPLAPSVAEGMYQLFLCGRSLAEIRALNPQYGLGAVVHGAVEGQWWARRALYFDQQVARAQQRAGQAVAETVDFVADLLAVIRRLHADQVARFLQSGRPEDLGPEGASLPLRQLKELADLLLRLTGQDKRQSVGGTIKHEHTLVVPMAAPPALTPDAAQAQLATWAQAARERLERDR